MNPHGPNPGRDPFRRALRWSAIVHGFLLGALILWPLLHQLLNRRKPPPPITMVDLVSLPELPVPTPPQPKTPEPPPPEPPKPPPEPKVADIKKAEPPKTNEVKKVEIKVSTNRVKVANTPPPKPNAPKLTPEEIRKLLAAGLPVGGPASSGTPSEWSVYYALVRAAMYDEWKPPASVTPGAGPQISIRVQRDGTITQRTMTRSSGNALLDESAMRAARAVTRISRPLPEGFSGSYRDITVDFELAGTAF